MTVTRKDIADALTPVAGIESVSEMPPDVVTPFAAWPIKRTTTPINDCARDYLWFVLVTLPGDQTSAIESADALEEPVIEALWAVGRVVLVEPVLITTGTPGDALPALRFQLMTD